MFACKLAAIVMSSKKNITNSVSFHSDDKLINNLELCVPSVGLKQLSQSDIVYKIK